DRRGGPRRPARHRRGAVRRAGAPAVPRRRPVERAGVPRRAGDGPPLPRRPDRRRARRLRRAGLHRRAAAGRGRGAHHRRRPVPPGAGDRPGAAARAARPRRRAARDGVPGGPHGQRAGAGAVRVGGVHRGRAAQALLPAQRRGRAHHAAGGARV
ncbi:MAG: Ribosomal-protein-S18p-alanine acetyltransferase, partial [uncultured Pseudonocardia sp.]